MGQQLKEALAQCDALRAELQKAQQTQNTCAGAGSKGRLSRRVLLALSQVGLLLLYFVAEDWVLL